MSRVVVTLTTIPSRLSDESESALRSCIDSLISQTYLEYEIHFNVPLINKLTNQEYIIPKWILDTKVKIFRIVNDLGPITKLLPTLERLDSPEDIIIVVDDDLVYHPDMISEQVKNQKKWSESAVGYDGLRSRDNFFGDIRDHYYTSNYRDSRVDILQHYKTVSYKRRYFEDDFLDFVEKNYSWADDLLVSAYMSYKKRDRIVTYHPNDPKFESIDEWRNGGGVTTFPVIRHTSHETIEGCNLYRDLKIDDGSGILYKYIDNGY